MYRLVLGIYKIISLILIRKHHVLLGKDYTIHGLLKISNAGSISIGNNVRINSGGYINPVGGSRRTALVTTQRGSIEIGNRCGISNSLLYSADRIIIEDNVMIGGGSIICDTDFHPIDYQTRMTIGVKAALHKPVVIKEGAFLGMNCIVLKGVTIGRHSVVGAGSVVTKNIPDGEIWGGNPARFIKRLE